MLGEYCSEFLLHKTTGWSISIDVKVLEQLEICISVFSFIQTLREVCISMHYEGISREVDSI